MKRLSLSSLLCFILLMSANAFGQGQFEGGSGTQSNPYLVATAEQFAAISNQPAGTYFRQVEDIDLMSGGEYVIAGTLDADNHSLSNISSLTLQQGATLKNANIVNGSVIVGQDASSVRIEHTVLQGDASFVVGGNATVELFVVSFNSENESNGILIGQGANVTFTFFDYSYGYLTIAEGANVTFEYVNIGGGFSSFTLAQNAMLTLKSGIELYNSNLENFDIQGTIVLDNENFDFYPFSTEWTILRNNMIEPVNVSLTANHWNFVGLCGNTNLEAFRSVSSTNEGERVWALAYKYETNTWDNNYLNYSSEVSAGDGIFVYPQQNITLPITSAYEQGNVTVSKTINYHSLNGDTQGWMAMSNPFKRGLSVDALLEEYHPNEAVAEGEIQGGVVYTRNIDERGDSWNTITYGNGGVIAPGQGFFVNMYLGNDGNEYSSRDFTFTLRGAWCNNEGAKKSSKAASRDFLTVSVATDGYKVPVMFAQNDQATEEYDIFDANKMFGDGSVAEPYLVCNGIELCKEEVNSENYTATMNIKSFESRSVEIVADNIPEGYSLTLLDGAVEVEMSEGDVYTTDITEGENADRFKLLINKNNVSIADVAETESVRVVNNNRSIAIYGGKNVRTEVYNALGQKVYETSDRTFDLNDVASGAYVLKVQDGKSVSSSKIIVR